MKTIRIIGIFILLVFSIAVLAYRQGVNSQTPDLTPTVTPEIIEQDWAFNGGCAPPCWFGLIPGESTSQDVAEFIATTIEIDNLLTSVERDVPVICCWYFQSEEIEGINNDELLDGEYVFYWFGDNRPDNTFIQNSLTIQDGMLDRITVFVPELIPVERVLQYYEQPDQIMFAVEITGEPFIFLDYFSIPMRVQITGETDSCNTPNIVEILWVDSVQLYSERFVEEMNWDTGYLQLLTMPTDIWNSWIDGNLRMTCDELIEILLNRLPEPSITPAISRP